MFLSMELVSYMKLLKIFLPLELENCMGLLEYDINYETHLQKIYFNLN